MLLLRCCRCLLSSVSSCLAALNILQFWSLWRILIDFELLQSMRWTTLIPRHSRRRSWTFLKMFLKVTRGAIALDFPALESRLVRVPFLVISPKKIEPSKIYVCGDTAIPYTVNPIDRIIHQHIHDTVISGGLIYRLLASPTGWPWQCVANSVGVAAAKRVMGGQEQSRHAYSIPYVSICILYQYIYYAGNRAGNLFKSDEWQICLIGFGR